MDANATLQELITLSHDLGQDSRHLVILGEGNTSADAGDGTFWVKASGSQLGNIAESGFSRVSYEAVKSLMRVEQAVVAWVRDSHGTVYDEGYVVGNRSWKRVLDELPGAGGAGGSVVRAADDEHVLDV